MNNHYVAIMAGGVGSRFWPKSRVSYPKQFIDILGTGRTLIQMTYDRFLNICPKENIFIVTNEDYRGIIEEQLPDLEPNQVLGEPLRRNTAPCIAYISHKVREINPEASMVVAPSDHIVMKNDAFTEVIKNGLRFAETHDALVTLGIVPTRPDTGYGYIQFLDEEENGKVYKVKTFTEKPTLEIARKFLKSGDFLWNSGIFIWDVETIVRAFKELQPDVYDVFHEGAGIYNTPGEKQFISKAYTLCKNISIDYGIMEKANNVHVIPADIGWSDLGTWQSLYEMYGRDGSENAVSGKNIMITDAKSCMVMAPDDKLVVLQGLEGYCVIDTGDVLLICERKKEQEIKQITAEVKKKFGERFL